MCFYILLIPFSFFFNTAYIELLHIRIAVKGNVFKLLKIASAGNVRKAAAIIGLTTIAYK